MQIVDAIKNLTIAMKGSGSVEDITADQIADAIQYMADNWDDISDGIGGGESYSLPEATTSTLGGVKKAPTVETVSAADATAAEETYNQAAAQSTVVLANANKAAINAILANLKSAGIMA